MRTFLLALLLLPALALAACGDDGEDSGPAEGRISVVATTTQLADIAEEVGGDRVSVERILDPNSDPHDYEPRPSDAENLAGADVVLRSGGDLDEWLDDLLENAGGDAAVVTALDAAADTGGDPHWWQDPRNAQRVALAVRDALIEADPGRREAFTRSAEGYAGRLGRLDVEVAQCIDQIPRGQRKLVTTHDALGLYADRYGLQVVGALIPSRSTQAQPSAGDTAKLVDQIRELGVPAIFPENSLDPELEAAVAREAEARVGGALYADTLGPDGTAGATYIGSIAANTATIVEGLTGGRESCRPRA